MRTISILPGAIHSVCKDLDISRDELSRRMGVASTTAYRVDNRATEPSARFVASLMGVSGRSFEALFEIVEAAA
jgi:transcriptional regulator with XRE-family HTH domain